MTNERGISVAHVVQWILMKKKIDNLMLAQKYLFYVCEKEWQLFACEETYRNVDRSNKTNVWVFEMRVLIPLNRYGFGRRARSIAHTTEFV